MSRMCEKTWSCSCIALVTGWLIGNLYLNENSSVKPCYVRQFSSQLCLVILMPRCETLKYHEKLPRVTRSVKEPVIFLATRENICCSIAAVVAVIRTWSYFARLLHFRGCYTRQIFVKIVWQQIYDKLKLAYSITCPLCHVRLSGVDGEGRKGTREKGRWREGETREEGEERKRKYA